jgi:hypothetical protein
MNWADSWLEQKLAEYDRPPEQVPPCGWAGCAFEHRRHEHLGAADRVRLWDSPGELPGYPRKDGEAEACERAHGVSDEDDLHHIADMMERLIRTQLALDSVFSLSQPEPMFHDGGVAGPEWVPGTCTDCGTETMVSPRSGWCDPCCQLAEERLRMARLERRNAVAMQHDAKARRSLARERRRLVAIGGLAAALAMWCTCWIWVPNVRIGTASALSLLTLLAYRKVTRMIRGRGHGR